MALSEELTAAKQEWDAAVAVAEPAYEAATGEAWERYRKALEAVNSDHARREALRPLQEATAAALREADRVREEAMRPAWAAYHETCRKIVATYNAAEAAAVADLQS